jgi:two-component system osmolarity sensor histidine kinase EnvZ
MVATRDAITDGEEGAGRTKFGTRTVRVLARRAYSRLRLRHLTESLSDWMPKGLYTRALIIIIAPIVLLEGVVAFVFMERHWQVVTRRLSEATARDISALIVLYETYPFEDEHRRLKDLASDQLGVSFQVLPPAPLPAALPRPFFALLDKALTAEIERQIKHPFWIDTVGQSRHVEIRVQHAKANLRFVVTRSQAYASSSHIFLLWMIGTAVVLLSVAILFLRNQIKPIVRLAEAADAFGKGRPGPDDFHPRGAREVRQAAQAFLEMRERIKTHVDQRTTMLAGVSHDLRTVLTRFKLSLALAGDSPETKAMRADVVEMQHMLEDYLAFAKGDGGEEATATDIGELLSEIHEDAQLFGAKVVLDTRKRRKDVRLPLKRQAMKRAITNLVTNAARFGNRVIIRAKTERHWLLVSIDDDGPGIPPEKREIVFKPFYRLDHARNQNEGNSGLGLAIARDIVRGHGGDITLEESKLGGLRAEVRVPL